MTALSRSGRGEASLMEAMDALRTVHETQRYKGRIIECLPPTAARILDVGCGTGDDVLALAEWYGPETLVVGLERSSELLEEAERRARAVALTTRFVLGDALALPFPDGQFDVVVADRLLADVEDVELAIAEMARVTRGGGVVVAHERDAASLVCDSAIALAGGTTAHDVTLGRRLRRLFCEVGLKDVVVADVSAWFAEDAAAAERLFGLSRVGAWAEDPGFVAAGMGFTVRGRREGGAGELA